jgi:hypothetical protein
MLDRTRDANGNIQLWGNDLAGRIDGLDGLAPKWRIGRTAPPNFDDLAVLDSDVADETLGTGSIDDGAADDLQIEHALSRGVM